MQETNGSVIITTHHENIISEAPHVTKVQIDLLGQRAGSEMLLKYLGRDVRNDPERQLAMEVSANVGGLPVAIAAGSCWHKVEQKTSITQTPCGKRLLKYWTVCYHWTCHRS